MQKVNFFILKHILGLDPYVLKQEKEKLTSIRINSKYIFKSKETGTTWIFQTNEPRLILVGNPAYGAEPYRACSSKNFLESSIIKEITELE